MTDQSAKSEHWEGVYRERRPNEVSWFEPSPTQSLELITEAGVGPDAGIIDVGGGASSLAAELLARGHTDITVADLSTRALRLARAGVEVDADAVTWIQADIRSADFGRRFDLWHDRAVFHFMVDATDRDAYIATLERHLKPGGHALLATFGPQGPEQCSGLPVRRYNPAELDSALGPDFSLVSSITTHHSTPTGTTQQFLYSHFRRVAPTS